MDKRKQAAKNQQEDIVLTRTLLWFGGAVIVEALLLLLERYYINYGSSEISTAVALMNAMPTIVAVLSILAVGASAWMLLQHRKGGSLRWPGLCAGIFFALAVGVGLTWKFNAAGNQLMCAIVPAVAVLALVYYLYQHEFFASALVVSLGILGLWVIRGVDGSKAMLIYGLCAGIIVVAGAVAVLFNRAQQGKGTLTISGRKVRIFDQDVNYVPGYASCGLVVVALAVALALGTSAAYYLLFGLVAWLFILAVYYTVRQM